ncbi:M20/M25/M40 family metallo-hydrolase [Rhizohabitans arisaemae]|uniref:M20/M25/M40 family metallo-hydrolase n=1 Tax=Rhizohabitans arisaemae TaxID=2720610 RepID=UPI0024B12CD3|nr:M20/M25/M40 family metallo-hydrolase [Rhizohabitans arisaemae]
MSQPAVSAKGDDLGPVAERLARLMRDCGLESAVLPTGGAPIVFGKRKESDRLPTILVYGHYDVQPVEPLSAWSSDPFTPVIRDGRMYGRGTADNKGQHLAQLLAMKAVLEAYGRLPVNVVMIVEGEEEIGSPNLERWVAEHAHLLRADFAYTSDGAVHPSGRPVVLCGSRGLLYLELTLRVASADRHSGNFGGVSRNAALELARVIGSLWGDDGEIAVPGFCDAVAEPADEERAAVAALPLTWPIPASEMLPRVDSPSDWFGRVLLRPNLNVSGLGSGWTGPSMKTVIPATATAKLDVRLVPDQDPHDVARLITEWVRAQAPDVEVDVISAVKPSRTPLDSPVVERVSQAVEFAWEHPPLVYPSLAGTVPDFVFTSTLALPSVIVPYGNADQANHAPDENMLLDFFHKGARTFVSVLHAFAP